LATTQGSQCLGIWFIVAIDGTGINKGVDKVNL
jgi:hypothetical protein